MIHQVEFDQFLAVEISGVLAELLQQPMAILIRQATDHLQEVLGELGIGYELRLSPLGRPAASGEKPPTRSPGSTHRSQRVWRPAGHGASELRDDGYLDEIGPTPSPVPRKPVGRRLKDTQAKTEGAGFEPAEAFTSPVFKTGAINHSTTPPGVGVGPSRHHAHDLMDPEPGAVLKGAATLTPIG